MLTIVENWPIWACWGEYYFTVPRNNSRMGVFSFIPVLPVVSGVNNYCRIVDAEGGGCLLIFPDDEGRRHDGGVEVSGSMPSLKGG